MIYIGVDPGSRSGAYADIRGGVVEVFPWDDVFFAEHLKSLLATGDRCKAVVEKVGAMPKQGISSTWAFAKNAGYIEGCLTSLGISFQLVPPKTWKKEFSLTGDKAKSIDVCRKLFPGVDLRRNDNCRVNDNNLAEALLMAEYARRKM